MPDDAELASLERAVGAAPHDAVLRLILARAYATLGRRDDAVRHAASVLALDPRNAEALALVARGGRTDDSRVLAAMEAEFAEAQPPAPVTEPTRAANGPRGLADVAGMAAAKERLEHIFFGPLKNPSIASLYGVRAGGGLLLYGPPGCGKTYLSQAVAAEIGAQFIAATAADIYSKWLGESEQHVQQLYTEAAHRAPCVVFLDEIDAIGQRRSALGSSAARGTVNQLLVSMDGAAETGVLTIAATNHPWDVDPALRRPGRLDRMVLVEPPDRTTRAEVLRVHLRDKPVEALDLGAVADATGGFSGADLAHVVTTAVQAVLTEALRTGAARPVTTRDLLDAARGITPSTLPWFDTARTVVRFAGRTSDYDDLRTYMRREKLL